MGRIERDERRARLGLRHHLSERAGDPVTAAGRLVGLHSSDPATVFLSARARVEDLTVADLEAALYEQRSLARLLGMRRTMFVVPLELAPVLDAACTRALAPSERRRLITLVEDQGIADEGGAWLDRVEADTLEALRVRGEATAGELTEDVPELALKLSFGEGKSWAGTVGISTRVLFLLATDARIVRARPRGSWISSQYRWALSEAWFGAGIDALGPAEARVDLARRWLRTYGPGSLADLKWWTGWTVAQTRSALSEAEAVEVELDDGPGYVLTGDEEILDPPSPWVALLPSLDPTVMGWKERDWYLGPHASALFDRNGNAGPTVWSDGRIVGGWAQRKSGEVVWGVLENVDSEVEGMIEAEARALQRWLDGTVVTPRFPTRLQRELTG